MNKVPRVTPEETHPITSLVEERTRRLSLFRIIAWLSFTAFSVFLVGYIVGWALIPDFPVLLIWADVVAVLLTVVVLVMLPRAPFEWAVGLYVAGVTFVLFTAIYFVNGTTGPIVLALPLIALIAGELGGRRIAYITAGAHVALYLVLAVAEMLGIVVPFQMPAIVSRIVWIGIFITGTAVTVAVNQQFVAFMQGALFSSQERERALTEANLRAQEAAEAERTVQEQAITTAQQLQAVVRAYSAFLERVTRGDYQAILDLEALTQQQNLSPELLDLGQYLNTTVTSLVAALGEAQLAQQRYLQQSWAGVAEGRTVPTGYRYRSTSTESGAATNVEIAEGAWLSPMTEAVRVKATAQSAQELATPIAVGGQAQIIGVLGIRRDGGAVWAEDELVIITAVADQLAQTIENLRLLDETGRRAAREQQTGEITARIREAVEIEAVLERALGELGQALAAERGTAFLALGELEESSV